MNQSEREKLSDIILNLKYSQRDHVNTSGKAQIVTAAIDDLTELTKI